MSYKTTTKVIQIAILLVAMTPVAVLYDILTFDFTLEKLLLSIMIKTTILSIFVAWNIP